MRIYMKLSEDSMGNSGEDLESYAAFVLGELSRLYPEARIEVETTQRESGIMPLVIEAETWQEEEAAELEIAGLWDRYCSR